MISRLDFVGIPSQDSERSRSFYVDTLGLRPDERAEAEFWVGETCFGIWEPARFGWPFAPQKNAHIALQVSQSAYVLEVGRVALSGPSAELEQHESVRKSYLGY